MSINVTRTQTMKVNSISPKSSLLGMIMKPFAPNKVSSKEDFYQIHLDPTLSESDSESDSSYHTISPSGVASAVARENQPEFEVPETNNNEENEDIKAGVDEHVAKNNKRGSFLAMFLNSDSQIPAPVDPPKDLVVSQEEDGPSPRGKDIEQTGSNKVKDENPSSASTTDIPEDEKTCETPSNSDQKGGVFNLFWKPMRKQTSEENGEKTDVVVAELEEKPLSDDNVECDEKGDHVDQCDSTNTESVNILKDGSKSPETGFFGKIFSGNKIEASQSLEICKGVGHTLSGEEVGSMQGASLQVIEEATSSQKMNEETNKNKLMFLTKLIMGKEGARTMEESCVSDSPEDKEEATETMKEIKGTDIEIAAKEESKEEATETTKEVKGSDPSDVVESAAKEESKEEATETTKEIKGSDPSDVVESAEKEESKEEATDTTKEVRGLDPSDVVESAEKEESKEEATETTKEIKGSDPSDVVESAAKEESKEEATETTKEIKGSDPSDVVESAAKEEPTIPKRRGSSFFAMFLADSSAVTSHADPEIGGDGGADVALLLEESPPVAVAIEKPQEDAVNDEDEMSQNNAKDVVDIYGLEIVFSANDGMTTVTHLGDPYWDDNETNQREKMCCSFLLR